MKAYHAYASNKKHARTASSPRAAAVAFFESNPGSRKCDICEGESEGGMFTAVFGRIPPRTWKSVTPKAVGLLPGEDPS